MYRGTWQIEAGIRNEELPVTWHQARPNNEQDLEIYRIVVDLWRQSCGLHCEPSFAPNLLGLFAGAYTIVAL